MLDKGIAIDFFTDCSSGCGMLFGPVFLLVLTLEIISSISSGEVGFIMKECGLGFFKKAL